MPKSPRWTLHAFATQKREEQFRIDFAKKYGQSAEERYPDVPFTMVYDLHHTEFKDPFGTPVQDAFRRGQIRGQNFSVSLSPVPGQQQAEHTGDIEKSDQDVTDV